MDVFILENCPTIVDDLRRCIESGVTPHDLIVDTGYQIFGLVSDDYLNNYWKSHEREFEKALEFIWTWYINEDECHFDDNIQKMLFVYQVLATDFED